MRPVTVFRNRFLCLVHDPAQGGCVVPGTGQRIVTLAEFWRALLEQRRIHANQDEPYWISQQLVPTGENHNNARHDAA
jgi:hypothetical protein